MTVPCRHTVMPTGYVDWHFRAEELTAKGYTQEQCPVCGLWAIWKRRRSS